MAASYGFVYVLGMAYMPGVYKIGYTDSHPKVRVEQLSRATACPEPFDLLAYFGTPHAREVEQKIHGDLSMHRLNKEREFFLASADVVLNVIYYYFDGSNEALYDDGLRERCQEEQEERDAKWPVEYFFSQCADPIFWPEPFKFDPEEIPF